MGRGWGLCLSRRLRESLFIMRLIPGQVAKPATIPSTSCYNVSMKLLPAGPVCSHQQNMLKSLTLFGTPVTPTSQARRL